MYGRSVQDGSAAERAKPAGSMLIDTDVLIWCLRGDRKAATFVEGDAARSLSIVTLMELMQGAKSRDEIRVIRRFLLQNEFQIIPLNEAIGHTAANFVEDFAMSHGVQLGDALVAATAKEHGLALATANVRHFRVIPGLELRAFRPSR
jgi:predicted nucleic acid-binding protein